MSTNNYKNTDFFLEYWGDVRQSGDPTGQLGVQAISDSMKLIAGADTIHDFNEGTASRVAPYTSVYTYETQALNTLFGTTNTETTNTETTNTGTANTLTPVIQTAASKYKMTNITASSVENDTIRAFELKYPERFYTNKPRVLVSYRQVRDLIATVYGVDKYNRNTKATDLQNASNFMTKNPSPNLFGIEQVEQLSTPDINTVIFAAGQKLYKTIDQCAILEIDMAEEDDWDRDFSEIQKSHIGIFLLNFFFQPASEDTRADNSTYPTYITFDAGSNAPTTVFRTLTQVMNMVSPLNIADSATTANHMSGRNYYIFPTNNPENTEYKYRSNIMTGTKSELIITPNSNPTYSHSTRFDFNIKATFRPENSTAISNTYDFINFTSGPGVNYISALIDSVSSNPKISDTYPVPRLEGVLRINSFIQALSDKSSTIPAQTIAEILFDWKRSGDWEQCNAAKIANVMDSSPTQGRTVLATIDRLCSLYSRMLKQNTILHHGLRMVLYRFPATAMNKEALIKQRLDEKKIDVIQRAEFIQGVANKQLDRVNTAIDSAITSLNSIVKNTTISFKILSLSKKTVYPFGTYLAKQLIQKTIDDLTEAHENISTLSTITAKFQSTTTESTPGILQKINETSEYDTSVNIDKIIDAVDGLLALTPDTKKAETLDTAKPTDIATLYAMTDSENYPQNLYVYDVLTQRISEKLGDYKGCILLSKIFGRTVSLENIDTMIPVIQKISIFNEKESVFGKGGYGYYDYNAIETIIKGIDKVEDFDVKSRRSNLNSLYDMLEKFGFFDALRKVADILPPSIQNITSKQDEIRTPEYTKPGDSDMDIEVDSTPVSVSDIFTQILHTPYDETTPSTETQAKMSDYSTLNTNYKGTIQQLIKKLPILKPNGGDLRGGDNIDIMTPELFLPIHAKLHTQYLLEFFEEIKSGVYHQYDTIVRDFLDGTSISTQPITPLPEDQSKIDIALLNYVDKITDLYLQNKDLIMPPTVFIIGQKIRQEFTLQYNTFLLVVITTLLFRDNTETPSKKIEPDGSTEYQAEILSKITGFRFSTIIPDTTTNTNTSFVQHIYYGLSNIETVLSSGLNFITSYSTKIPNTSRLHVLYVVFIVYNEILTRTNNKIIKKHAELTKFDASAFGYVLDAKIPYTIEPRIDTLEPPFVPTDNTGPSSRPPPNPKKRQLEFDESPKSDTTIDLKNMDTNKIKIVNILNKITESKMSKLSKITDIPGINQFQSEMNAFLMDYDQIRNIFIFITGYFAGANMKNEFIWALSQNTTSAKRPRTNGAGGRPRTNRRPPTGLLLTRRRSLPRNRKRSNSRWRANKNRTRRNRR